MLLPCPGRGDPFPISDIIPRERSTVSKKERRRSEGGAAGSGGTESVHLRAQLCWTGSGFAAHVARSLAPRGRPSGREFVRRFVKRGFFWAVDCRGGGGEVPNWRKFPKREGNRTSTGLDKPTENLVHFFDSYPGDQLVASKVLCLWASSEYA